MKERTKDLMSSIWGQLEDRVQNRVYAWLSIMVKLGFRKRSRLYRRVWDIRSLRKNLTQRRLEGYRWL